MNGYTPYLNFFNQIWVVPTTMTPQTPFYPSMAFYTQPFNPLHFVTLTNNVVQNRAPELAQVGLKSKPDEVSKTAAEENQQKNQPDKATVFPESSVSKQQTNKTQTKQIKRPQSYLTEKAFYMKQKLKGKFKSGNRILRKRLRDCKQRESKNCRNGQGEKSNKSLKQSPKTQKKRLPIPKDSEKQRKVVKKIKMKLIQQYREDFAVVPQIISGIKQLNAFCRQKIQNLMSRQANFV